MPSHVWPRSLQSCHTMPPAAATPDDTPMHMEVDLGGRVVARDIHRIADGGIPATVGLEARARMASSSTYLARCVEERRLIYGVTTGFGPLARHHIAPEHSATLQRNLLYHLASGVGAPLADCLVRATIAARVSSLARGYSGIGAATIDLLLACLARGVTPVVPERGSVGASGDLTPLAHIALVLIGEGRARHAGEVHSGADALRAAGLLPIALGHKEALALVNGTSAMTGIAALNAVRAERAAALMARLAVLHAEVTGGHVEAWDERFGTVRPHPGQIAAHAALQAHAAGGTRLTPLIQPPPRIRATVEGDGVFSASEPHQDPYTVRCVPQELGAILDVLDFHARIVDTELNAATDNPLVLAPGTAGDEGAVLHGGNFYGQHVAFASDALVVAMIKLAVWAERALARLTNPVYSRGLPAFLHGGVAGLNSGFMGAQVTATALLAEMRTHAVPASIQSISTNNDNQDVVTMGTIAARKASTVLDMVWELLAIHAMALAQAAELRTRQAGHGAVRAAGFAPAGAELVAFVRTRSATLDVDRPLSGEITAVAAALERWATLDESVVTGA